GRPLSQLTDAVVPLEALWSRELWQPLAAASPRPARVLDAVNASLQRALSREGVYDPASARGVRRALAVIAAAPSLPRVTALAAEVGMSERQLRRGFDHVVGLSPKQYLRVVRFRRALKAARQAAQPQWAAIAEQAGYFDQAHMIAEFRELACATPAVLLQGEARHAR
ncbi:MAG: helix-turn-helix transcriptional regulator, partial [Polyangiales bacterium]